MSEIVVGSVRARAGQRVQGVINAGQTSDGAPIEIPVLIVSGKTLKPVVWVLAAVHGAELTGTVAVLEAGRSLDPSVLTGTAVLVPVVNVPAFRRWMRVSDIDFMDVNRVFPGNAAGAFTERLAKTLGDAVLANADYFLDVHTASDPRICAPHLLYREGAGNTSAVAKRLAMSVGMEAIWGSTDSILDRSLFDQATKRGIPSLIFEAGGSEVEDRYLQVLKEGIRNFLIAARMLGGDAPRLASYLLLDTWSNVYSNAGGLCVPQCEVGSVVDEGTPLVKIVNLYGEVVDEVCAPHGPTFVRSLIRPYHPVPSGQLVAALLKIKGRETFPH